MPSWSSRKNSLPAISLSHHRLSELSLVNPFLRNIDTLLQCLGLRSYFCRYQSRINIYSSAADEKLYRKISGRLVNLGAGGFRHPKWINYDYPGESLYYRRLQGVAGKDFQPIDLCSDLTDLGSEPVSAFYISHTLEHLPFSYGESVLSHIYSNLLASDGVIRIAVPDHEKTFYQLKASIIPSMSIFEDALREFTTHMLSKTSNLPIWSVAELFESSKTIESFFDNIVKLDPAMTSFDPCNPGNHLSLWSIGSIKELCFRMGVNSLNFRSANSSPFPPFTNNLVFDTTEPQHSLYFEIT